MTRYIVEIRGDSRYPEPFCVELPCVDVGVATAYLVLELDPDNITVQNWDAARPAAEPLLVTLEMTDLVEDPGPCPDGEKQAALHRHSINDIDGYRVLIMRGEQPPIWVATIHGARYGREAHALADGLRPRGSKVENRYRCGCWSWARYPGDRGVIDEKRIAAMAPRLHDSPLG